MPNQIILNMHEAYPFGAQYVPQKQNQQVLVRKLLFTANKQELLSKIKFFQKLKIPNTIQILSIFQHPKSIEIYYEYVGIKLEMWMKNMSEQLQANLRKQLYAISRFLADNRISTKFNPEDIGLDKNYHIKYFIDLQNTVYNLNFNPRQLKQVFDREIAQFLNSTEQESDKIIQNAHSFSSQLQLKNLLQKSPNFTLNPNLDRNCSVKTFNQKHNQISVNTQTSSNQLQTQLKQSAPLSKSQHNRFHEKINKIKQKFQFTKQKVSKMSQSVFELQYSSKNKQIKAKSALLSRKLPKTIKTHKCVSFQNDLQNEQQTLKWIKPQIQHHSEYKRQHSQKSLQFIMKQDKKIKSEKYKTPKNSESPIQYLDMVRSPSAYVIDFLNVLEDSSEQEDSQEQERSFAMTLRNGKDKVKTQQSQKTNQTNEQKWKTKYNQVIANSKKLINRMRTNSSIIKN